MMAWEKVDGKLSVKSSSSQWITSEMNKQDSSLANNKATTPFFPAFSIIYIDSIKILSS